MAKRIAIIDIGSNSARLAIFQNTSKSGFHLVCEQKSRVRIGEGAYEHHGKLQKIGMDRAFKTLKSFSQTIDEFKVNTVIAVATSALRDAPNRQIFLDRVKQKLGLEIQIIHGKEEALFGGIAANNLLPLSEGITIDIGGGSSDMSLIKKGKIIETYSLDLGTVRLKELFFDKKAEISTIQHYIRAQLKSLPESFKASQAIGIGGTARTLAKAIIIKSKYPLNKLHAYNYALETHESYFRDLISAELSQLDQYHIKQNRHDTIREGALIYLEILKHIGAKDIMTSGVGVREGAYLHHKLKKTPFRLHANTNPSVKSMRDRFDILSLPYGNKKKIAKKLYALLKHHLDQPEKYLKTIKTLLALSDIGKVLTIYQKDKHASYIAIQELNYGFSHEEMTLVSLLLYSKSKRGYHKGLYKQYKLLLPPKKTIKWLAFIYTLTLLLHRNSARANYTFSMKGDLLSIESDKSLYLAIAEIEEMKKPKRLKIEIK